MEPGDYKHAPTFHLKCRITEGLKQRGMHNSSLMVTVQGPVMAYPLFDHSLMGNGVF
jgi:hypothetical protein